MLHTTKNLNQDQNNCGTGLSVINSAPENLRAQVSLSTTQLKICHSNQASVICGSHLTLHKTWFCFIFNAINHFLMVY